jgi:hypothetical protein
MRDRRSFLASSAGTLSAALFSHWPLESLAQIGSPAISDWDAGRVRHILPSVSDSRILIKCSFDRPLSQAPTLRVDSQDVPGVMSDTAGEFWQFYTGDLDSGRRYTLSLTDNSGSALCEPWPLSTFPDLAAQPERCRILFYTCAGGPGGRYDGIGQRRGFLPTEIRNRLLRRALSFEPDAVIANGDHMYWDLHDWRGDEPGALSANGRESNFDFSTRVFSGNNEASLKAAAGPQIIPVYGNDFRSTPVFFLQDDHDHWENDAVTDDFASYPIAWFQLQLARATQSLFYPEFLPDPRRPMGLPWSGVGDRGDRSESFGTLRFGSLTEILLYDVRRTVNLAGPNAVFVDSEVERWLIDRTRSNDTRHLVHEPSNPFGWSAGKWGEWYPDILDPETGELTTAIEKPYWQRGWLRQHDRIAEAMGAQRDRIAMTISGDMHAVGAGQILRSGSHEFERNPINAILSGPIGTSPGAFPSRGRGIGATPSKHLDLLETSAPLEEHGFTLVDFFPDRAVVRQYKWDVNREPLEALDRLEPFFTTELEPPA